MEMIHCPGCASGAEHGSPTCPVCGAPRAPGAAVAAPRNPFKLIACCVLWALAFWFASVFLAGASGARLGGFLLLASIGLSIALTVRGKLPGTIRPEI